LALMAFSSASFAQNKKVLLVSDLDDTIKVSHILSASKLGRAFDVTTPFRGMAELYKLIVNENPLTTKVVYLSNAPEQIAQLPILKYSHQTFLKYNNFPEGELDLREDIFTKNHKITELRRLIETEKPDVVIMIGDNGEKDVDVYHQATAEYHHLGIQMITFIHQLYATQIPFYKFDFLAEQGRELYPEQNGFVTPIEISLQLNQENLLQAVSVNKMLNEVAPLIVSERRVLKIDGGKPLSFPFFKNCEDYKAKSFSPEFDTSEINRKIAIECN
jgi:hypothetical protein